MTFPAGRGNRTTCGEFNFVFDPEAAQMVLSRNDRTPSADITTTSAAAADTGRSMCPVIITPLETCLQEVDLPIVSRSPLYTSLEISAEICFWHHFIHVYRLFTHSLIFNLPFERISNVCDNYVLIECRFTNTRYSKF